ncbi:MULTISPECIES: DUF427 domain-containing protein [Pseudomonas]|jgi:uncharacterized protein (DUF427 family)|uniref:DUF427 domain-containing protein n=1 Tax=Pseudomonas folii TaxID=2762593 RepID=A0ABR7B7R8_9PSED|nr:MULTISPECIES: DUF427 domain-containing protein [Pseudomonas]MBC3953220.1 DUF427 domain-containing protein [Pseudomonas folii]
MKTPDYDHPITITPCKGPVSVMFEETLLARSDHALLLEEAKYPPVIYIPRSDIRIEHYVRTEHQTHCPYKGDANYFSLDIHGLRIPNAVWTYEQPYRAVAQLRNHVAFYPERVTFVTEMPHD